MLNSKIELKNRLFSTPLTTLDTKSLKLHNLKHPTYREYLRASDERDFLIAHKFYSLMQTELGDDGLEKFCNCRKHANFARNRTTGLVKVLTNSCHLRFCPFCTRSRGTMIYRNVIDYLKTAKYPKFLTLTLKHSDSPLKTQLDILYYCFKKLRRIRFFDKAVSGGIWFFQVKKSSVDKLWHPHLHCIIAGNYIPLRKLQKEWMRITGKSFVVDLRLIKDQKKAANYVARYAVRPCDLKDFDFEDAKEIYFALQKRRLCGTWKKCRKLKLTTPPKFVGDEWKIIANWQTVMYMKHDNVIAQQILSAWLKNEPIADDIELSYIDDFLRGYSPPDISVDEPEIEKLLF